MLRAFERNRRRALMDINSRHDVPPRSWLVEPRIEKRALPVRQISEFARLIPNARQSSFLRVTSKSYFYYYMFERFVQIPGRRNSPDRSGVLIGPRRCSELLNGRGGNMPMRRRNILEAFAMVLASGLCPAGLAAA